MGSGRHSNGVWGGEEGLVVTLSTCCRSPWIGREARVASRAIRGTIHREGRAVDDPAMPDPDQLPSERLKELRSELFKHFGKLTRWKVLCQERGAMTDEEKIRLAEEVLKAPSTGTVAEWWGSHLRLKGKKSFKVEPESIKPGSPPDAIPG